MKFIFKKFFTALIAFFILMNLSWPVFTGAQSDATSELPDGNTTPAQLPAVGQLPLNQIPGLNNLSVLQVPLLGNAPVASAPGLRDITFGDLPFLSGLPDMPDFSFLKDIPGLDNLPLKDIPNLKDLPLNQIPGLNNLSLGNIPGLKDMYIGGIPGLKDTAMKDIPGLKDQSFGSIPGLKDTPGLKDIPGIKNIPVGKLNTFFESISTLFAGTIEKKSLKVCIVSYFPPVMFPLQYVEIRNTDNSLSKLYRLFFISKIYRRDRLEKTSLALGNNLPGAQAFKALCRKKPKPPDADGIIWKIGTSCKAGEMPGRKCKS
ncbi:MAG: hypothetical protein A2751_05915 [Candidatus Doudnabacteria bacterium RIFCSPHIGHO2_01_FULL_46_14]|uniref:Uncharacterized protein n=1 Tax=Candidatus Doudnabacteria bacterium RIFCSPHIGHO2_01_FULL_46_14 TaxID=1817824 RepID=A0A1F5NN85_9BACT|nr:MAG: hypothetical protein A2751_05915 [Candidatus Doudnabacteria bacterium RIFCSPHIGHO2_01_FULL_46_14]